MANVSKNLQEIFDYLVANEVEESESFKNCFITNDGQKAVWFKRDKVELYDLSEHYARMYGQFLNPEQYTFQQYVMLFQTFGIIHMKDSLKRFKAEGVDTSGLTVIHMIEALELPTT